MPTRAIKAIFFTRFHHEKGSRVLHQVPEGSITPSKTPSALAEPLFSFESITSYLIPTQQFCDRLLTFCISKCRVIGYPVCIREGKYSRNEFIFNFALVVEEGLADWVAFGEVVRKLGRLLRGLEEQGGFLSGEEEGRGVWEDDGAGEEAGLGFGGGSKVYALCEMVLEDLNNYAECMIPIDDSNTINLKLFPTRPPPPPIHAHTVPLLTISLSTLSTPISSDLTLSRILPYINGINSVSHIAQLADTDLSLTRKAIQHLVYYSCLVLLDIFSFGAVYAPTAEIGGFIVDEGVKEECMRYVAVPRIRWGSNSNRGAKLGSESDRGRGGGGGGGDERSSSISSSTSQHSETYTSASGFPAATDADPAPSDSHPLTHDTLITLYTSLRQGLTLRNWVLDNLPLLSGIDIRRLITFGVIKGFLYRVHKYAIATSLNLPPAPPTSLQSGAQSTVGGGHAYRDSDTSTIRGHLNTSHITQQHTNANHHTNASGLHHKPSLASTTTHTTTNLFSPGAIAERQAEEVTRLDSLVSDGVEGGLPLVKFLDGMHCFDEICTELGMSEKAVEGKIRGVGEVQVFSR
ncbi:nitrogen permease regulator 2 [Lentithecium fluviatile CBS 122367]|uniref:Nitrogen permease regulator 2 n=1 Tax=Lentithecium fluviatile CBS 122367 TaxID=1168545 RepID=A0A6G1ISK8_9PLEO|nr:nitrogen permease regulator 2 [Lentithecium fluviatile CBS 122367]